MSNLSYYKHFFKAISNKTRFEIIQLLRRGPKNVTQICKKLGFEQSRVSHNLKCLSNCGFVNYKWENGNKNYSLDKKAILPLLNAVDRHIKKYGDKLKTCRILKESNK